jgi:hypothetical protein
MHQLVRLDLSGTIIVNFAAFSALPQLIELKLANLKLGIKDLKIGYSPRYPP